MAYKKIICLIIIICIAIGITGCGTLDMMSSLKEEPNPDVADLTDLTDFEIVDDGLEDGAEETEEAVETITINTSNTRMTEIVAYYEDDNGYLVPVNTEIPWEEGIAKATLRSLVKGNETEQRIAQAGLHGVLPENTEIMGMNIKDGLCRVDLSQHALNTESYEQEQNMITAITYTLTEFPTINKVELLVQGQALDSLSKGYPINTAFQRENINLFGSESGANYTVYYKGPDTEVAGFYIPLTFSAQNAGNPVENVIAKLFDGPPADTVLSNKIPYGINLRDVSVVGGTAVLDLGVEAVNLSEEEFEEMNKIVVLCLEQFNEIENVDYKVEGLSFEEAGLNFEEDGVVPAFNEY